MGRQPKVARAREGVDHTNCNQGSLTEYPASVPHNCQIAQSKASVRQSQLRVGGRGCVWEKCKVSSQAEFWNAERKGWRRGGREED